MTHQELIERVASELAAQDGVMFKRSASFPDVQEDYRRKARAVVRITGEACAECAGVIVEHHRKVVEATDDNEVRQARYNAQVAAGVVQDRILSLTQGTKE